MSSIIFDVILLLILAISVLIGIKRGAVKVILSLAAFVCAAYLAFTLSTPAASFINNRFVEPKIINTVQTAISDTTQSLEDALPDFIINNAAELGISLEVDKAVDAEIFVSESISPIITGIISPIIMFVLFIVLAFVLNFAVSLLNKLIKISLLDGLNKALGGIFGGITGCILILILCVLIEQIITLNGEGFWIFTKEKVDSSYLYNFFANIL